MFAERMNMHTQNQMIDNDQTKLVISRDVPFSTKIIATAWAVGASALILSVSLGLSAGIIVGLLKLFRVIG